MVPVVGFALSFGAKPTVSSRHWHLPGKISTLNRPTASHALKSAHWHAITTPLWLSVAVASLSGPAPCSAFVPPSAQRSRAIAWTQG